jgi:hypothetical protein
MTTAHGRAICMHRLTEAATVGRDALATRWGNLGVFYQNDPDVAAHKDALKARVQ